MRSAPVKTMLRVVRSVHERMSVLRPNKAMNAVPA